MGPRRRFRIPEASWRTRAGGQEGLRAGGWKWKLIGPRHGGMIRGYAAWRTDAGASFEPREWITALLFCFRGFRFPLPCACLCVCGRPFLFSPRDTSRSITDSLIEGTGMRVWSSEYSIGLTLAATYVDESKSALRDRECHLWEVSGDVADKTVITSIVIANPR